MAFKALTPRQKEDLAFLRAHPEAAALWHEVGVGKTHPAIVRMLELIRPDFGSQYQRRALVVMKRALFGQWEEKIADVRAAYARPEWDNVRVGVLTGGRDFPRVLPDVLLTNYDILPKLEPWLMERISEWKLCLLDEAHKIKGFRGFRSKHGVRSKALNRLAPHFPHRIALSGSPVLNPNSSDVWAIYHFLDPRIFGITRWKFVSEFFYNLAHGQPYERLILKPGAQDEISRRMYTIARRVLKKECGDNEFPEPRRIPYYVEMSTKLAAKYHELRKTAITVVDGEQITRAHLLGRLMSLQQIASGWVIVDGEPVAIDASHKFAVLDDILEEVGDAPVIVWAHFRHEIESICAHLKRIGRKPVMVYGGLSETEQKRRIAAFKSGESDSFIGQPATAGAGLDLQRAQHAIRFSRSYTLEDFEQSEGRNNRAYSPFPHTVHHEIVTNGTRDRDVYEALRNKKDLSGMLTRDFLAAEQRNA